MTEYLEILTHCPLFAGIAPTELNAMLQCLNARTVTAPRRTPVLLEGDPACHVGVVLTGAVQIVREDYFGGRTVLTMAEAGDIFAEVFACANVDTLPVSAFAVQDSRVLLVDCRRILTLCKNTCTFHSRLIRNLLQAVAEKNLTLNQKIRFMSRRTTKEKLMAYLLEQAKRRQSPEFTIPFDRQALADYLGVERSAMSAEISKLKKEGVIDCRGSHFKIRDPENYTKIS